MANGSQERRWWPTSPYDFIDTALCPACFVPIRGAVCPNCRLELTDPRAAGLLELGRSILDAEAARQDLLEAIRSRPLPKPDPLPAPPSAPVAAEAPAPAAAAAAPAPAAPAPTVPLPAPEAPAPLPVPVATSAAAALVASPPPPPAPKRRLTVPVLLLIVGVSLVSVAAIFFLTLAWFFSSIATRALIIGGVTLATIATATFLRRRRLTTTAEGVAVIGIVLIALDVWGVRANDLFGTGSVRPAVYAGIGIVITGVLCRLWAALSKLRAPDFAAVLALPAGLGLLAAGIAHSDRLGALTAGLLGASLGALAHRLPSPISAARPPADAVVERAVLAAIGVAALVAGTISGWFASPEVSWLPVPLTAAVVALAVLHAFALRRPPGEALPASRLLVQVAAVTAVIAVGTTGWQLAARGGGVFAAAFLAPVLAVAVLVALLRTRMRREPSSAPTAPLIAAVIVAGGSLLITAARWLTRGAEEAAGRTMWTSAPFAASELAPALWTAAAAVAIAAMLLWVPRASIAQASVVRPLVVAPVLLLGAFASGVPAAVVIAGAALGALAVLVLSRGRRGLGPAPDAAAPLPDSRPYDSHRPDPHRAVAAAWVTASALGAAAGFAAGTANTALWVVAVLIAGVLPIALARVLRPRGTALSVAAVAPVAVSTLAALWAPAALGAVAGRPSGGALAVLVLVQWLAVLVLAVASIARFSARVRSALLGSGVALAAVGLTPLLVALLGIPTGPDPSSVIGLLEQPGLGVLRSGAAVLLLALTALRRELPVALRAAAAALLTPAVAVAAVLVVALALGVPAAAASPLLGGGLWGLIDEAGGRAAVAGAAALVAVVAAALALRGDDRSPVRLASDLGAVIVTLLALMSVSFSHRWAVLTGLAVVLAAASVSRGRRRVVPGPAEAPVLAEAPTPAEAPRTPRASGGVYAPPAAALAGPGVSAAGASSPAADPAPAGSLRRLLAWPALASAALAWWSGIAHFAPGGSVELHVLPVALGLALFCAALVRRGRRGEASLAIVLSLTLGLVVLAVAGWSGPSLRGTVVAVVAAALSLALTWSPLRAVRGVASSGATTALVAVAAVVMPRTAGSDDVGAAWILLLGGAAYLAALGFGRPPRAAGWFTSAVPPTALAASAFALLPAVQNPLVLTLTLIVLALIHLAAAWWNRAPLASGSRWAAVGGALLLAAVHGLLGTHDPFELLTLPVAAMLLAGALLALARHARTGDATPLTELPVWIAGLALAVLPSLGAGLTDPRMWIIVGACTALGLGAAALRHPFALASAFVLIGSALVMGVRALLAGEELAAGVTGAGAIALGAVLVRRKADAAPLTLIAPIAGALLASLAAVTATDRLLASTVITVVVATAVASLGALLLRAAEWLRLGAIIAIAGTGTAVLAAALRFEVAEGVRSLALEALLWPLAAAGAIGVVAAVTLLGAPNARLRFATGIALSTGAVLLALGELWALPTQTPSGAQLAALLTVTLLTAGAVASRLLPAMLGPAPLYATGAAGVLFAIVALAAHGIRPVELVTAPLALGLLAVGLHTLGRVPEARTWPRLGPGITLLTLPSLLHDFGATTLWRIVALGLVAVGLVVWGAVRRLQAPLVLGSAVLLVHATAQLWPWISAVYEATEWWLWAGVAGILLILVAVRYEKQKVAVRKAFTAIADLR